MSMTLAGSISVVLLVVVGPSHAQTRGPASAEAVRGLADALDRTGETAVAAEDPAAPGTFVAALHIPGSQLLVVKARHPSIEGVRHRISMRQYRETYLDLQATPTAEGKFFVQDARADGILSARPGGGDVDVLYEDGVRMTLFNGDADGQDLTRAGYDAKLAAADAEYARLLTILRDALQSAGRDERPTARALVSSRPGPWG